MTLLRIDASIQGPRSASSALADLVQSEYRPPIATRRSSLGTSAPIRCRRTPGPQPSPDPSATPPITHRPRPRLSPSPEVAAELTSADAVILALPLYNWGVSQHVKAWIDLAIAGRPHGTRLLDGTPVVLLATRGGAYGPGTPKEGWDHSIDYLRRVLAEVWGADLTVIQRGLTLVGVNPALDQLADLGAAAKEAAESAAIAAGRELGCPYGSQADAA